MTTAQNFTIGTMFCVNNWGLPRIMLIIGVSQACQSDYECVIICDYREPSNLESRRLVYSKHQLRSFPDLYKVIA